MILPDNPPQQENDFDAGFALDICGKGYPVLSV